MIYRLSLIVSAVILVLCGSASAGNENRVKPDEPIQQHSRYRSEVVYHSPNPIELSNLGDRLVYVHFRGAGFKAEDVVLESVMVQGTIPAYTEGHPRIENGWVITDCFVFRFLARYRPLPLESFRDKFTVEFDLINGEHIVLEGQARVNVLLGDLTLDGYVDQNDLEFLSDFLYHGGSIAEFEEMMDINRDGVVDALDLEALEEIIYGS